jgi:hypothetical protein
MAHYEHYLYNRRSGTEEIERDRKESEESDREEEERERQERDSADWGETKIHLNDTFGLY